MIDKISISRTISNNESGSKVIPIKMGQRKYAGSNLLCLESFVFKRFSLNKKLNLHLSNRENLIYPCVNTFSKSFTIVFLKDGDSLKIRFAWSGIKMKIETDCVLG